MGDAKRRGTREDRVAQGILARDEQERQREQRRLEQAMARERAIAEQRARERERRVVLVDGPMPRRPIQRGLGHRPNLTAALLAAGLAMAASYPSKPEEP